jgi:uncharacterized membrane protein
MLTTQNDDDEGGVVLSGRLMSFLLFGVALIFIGIVVLLAVSLLLGGSASVGGVIFIGPIPIVFGAGPDAGWLILLSVILAAVSVVLFLVMGRRRKSS